MAKRLAGAGEKGRRASQEQQGKEKELRTQLGKAMEQLKELKAQLASREEGARALEQQATSGATPPCAPCAPLHPFSPPCTPVHPHHRRRRRRSAPRVASRGSSGRRLPTVRPS